MWYVQPRGEDSWCIGGILTGDRKQHPKIPNDELQNIPRDPGQSWAYNLGIARNRFGKRAIALSSGGDIVLAPERPLTLQEASVVTHWIAISLPIR